TLSNWQQILTPASGVTSVFGRTGVIGAQSGDYTAAQVGALAIANDLSDLSSPSIARTNLGLGSLATKSSLLAADIPNLDAGKITTGVFADSQIPASIARDSEVQNAVSSKIDSSEKGQPGGVASLDAGGKVPTDQLPEFGAVQSVFGRTGAVVAQAGDYNSSQISGLGTIATQDANNVSITGGTATLNTLRSGFTQIAGAGLTVTSSAAAAADPGAGNAAIAGTLSVGGAIATLGNLNINATGSSEASPRLLQFSGLTSGTAVRVEFGDSFNSWSTANGKAMQLRSYHHLELLGGAEDSAISFSDNANYGVFVHNQKPARTAFNVRLAASQSANALSVEDNGSVERLRVTATGDLQLNAVGSTAGTPKVLGFRNLNSGNAVELQFGDNVNVLRAVHGQALQLISYHQLELNGGAEAASITGAEANANYGVLVRNHRAARHALTIRGAASQTGQLLRLENNSGTEVFAIASAGALSAATAAFTPGSLSNQIRIGDNVSNSVFAGIELQGPLAYNPPSQNKWGIACNASGHLTFMTTPTADTNNVVGYWTVNSGLFLNTNLSLTNGGSAPGPRIQVGGSNGLYNPSANVLSIAANATEAARFSSTNVNIPLTTASTSTTTGAATIAGGLGVGGAVNIGGNVAIGGSISSKSTGVTPYFTGLSTSASANVGIYPTVQIGTTGDYYWILKKGTGAGGAFECWEGTAAQSGGIRLWSNHNVSNLVLSADFHETTNLYGNFGSSSGTSLLLSGRSSKNLSFSTANLYGVRVATPPAVTSTGGFTATQAATLAIDGPYAGTPVLNAYSLLVSTGATKLGGNVEIIGTLKPGSYTVATLPAPGTAGRKVYATDAKWSGGIGCEVLDNGSIWLTPDGVQASTSGYHRIINASRALDRTDRIIWANTAGILITLPLVSAYKHVPYRSRNISAGDITITVSGTDTIEGVTSISLAAGNSYDFENDGSSSWRVM
ncbi:MAG TPA: hypothetical protein V6C63_05075, partial [Allocoleopsis sp.]